MVTASRTPSLNIQTNIRLAPFSWWRIGGPADYFVDIQSEEHLRAIFAWVRSRGIRHCIIGRGTNILFDDAGFRGCIIRIAEKMSGLHFIGNRCYVESGCWVPRLALAAARHGWGDLVHTIGIPASVGGLVVMNGGSQRRSIGTVIHQVKSIDDEGGIHIYGRDDLNLAYRESVFQHKTEVILQTTLHFIECQTYAATRPNMLAILRERRAKFPRKLPSCGSVFKSNPALYQTYGPPGKIIESLGFKGKILGGAQVSPHHANFIVNTGNASSVDVLSLVRHIYHAVRNKNGAPIDPEFRYIHPERGPVHECEWL